MTLVLAGGHGTHPKSSLFMKPRKATHDWWAPETHQTRPELKIGDYVTYIGETRDTLKGQLAILVELDLPHVCGRIQLCVARYTLSEFPMYSYGTTVLLRDLEKAHGCLNRSTEWYLNATNWRRGYL